MASNDQILDLLKQISSRLSNVEAKVGVGAATGLDTDEDAVAPFIIAFDELTSTYLTPFLETSNTIGKGVEIVGEIMKDGFNEMRKFLVMASRCKKPDDATLREKMKGIYDVVQLANKAKMNRKVPRDEGATVAEAAPAFGWVQMAAPMLPAPYLQDGPIDGHVFWSNKVRKANKDRDGGANHITWCVQIKALLDNLKVYVNDHHKTGVSWNMRGGNCAEYDSSSAAAPAKAAAAPPPAPAAAAAPAAPFPAAKHNLFAELANIDQSSGKTAGLRHVTKDMKSKNSTGVPAAPKPKPKATPAKKWGQGSSAPKVVKPPLCQLQGNKWAVENQVEMCTLEDVTPRQAAYIYNCHNATIIIKGKLNQITLDNCSRVKLLFDSVINLCEVVNSKNLQVQVRGMCPSVAIDKVDGILVYLSKETLPVTVFCTSKSSEMNVSFPVEGSDDYVERPIPEQFVHRVVDRQVTSDVSDLYSH